MWPKERDYPRKLRVGDHDYKIRFVSESTMTRLAGRDDIVGWCDGHSRMIMILRGQLPRQRFECVIHELLHAMEFEYKLKDLTHKLIHKLERPISQIWAETKLRRKLK